MASIAVQTSDLGSLEIRRLNSATKTAAVPWYIWCATLAVTSATVGGYWDISWHESIGRDTFWTPAHMAIYLCGVLAGLAFGYLILHTTFAKDSPLADSAVHIWGFKAPLGAFIASWGGIAMLTSAPFDNWWHAAYGIDVKIVSPPHILLIAGVYGVVVGTLVLIAGHRNRTPETAETDRKLILYICGIILIQTMILLMESTTRTALHNSAAYIATAALAPISLAIASRLTGYKFAATTVTALYTLFRVGLIWVLPLFPAEPKLGPVYQQVTHFIPPDSRSLFIVPAFALDLLWQRTKNWSLWKVALVSGLVWVTLFTAVQWPFATFLMNPASGNWFFGTHYLYYALPPTSYLARRMFYLTDANALQFWRGMLFAVVAATLSVWWGLARGASLGKIKR